MTIYCNAVNQCKTVIFLILKNWSLLLNAQKYLVVYDGLNNNQGLGIILWWCLHFCYKIKSVGGMLFGLSELNKRLMCYY